jgi:hypothetical protein
MIMGGSIKGAQVNRDEINVPTIECVLYNSTKLLLLLRLICLLQILATSTRRPIAFPFLNETIPFNLYPIVHTLPDGNLFVFANRHSIIYDYKRTRWFDDSPRYPEPTILPTDGCFCYASIGPKEQLQCRNIDLWRLESCQAYC